MLERYFLPVLLSTIRRGNLRISLTSWAFILPSTWAWGSWTIIAKSRNIRNGNKSLLDLSTKYKRNSSGDDKEGEKEGGDGAMGHQKGFYLQNIFNNINAYLPKGSPPRKKTPLFGHWFLHQINPEWHHKWPKANFYYKKLSLCDSAL